MNYSNFKINYYKYNNKKNILVIVYNLQKKIYDRKIKI